MAFVPLLAGLATALFSRSSLGGSSSSAQLAASEATYEANENELIASNTRLNTQATKSSETTNVEELHVAMEEAHNHVVRSYIDAVKQTQ